MSIVKVRHVPNPDPIEEARAVVLEGSVAGFPQVTFRWTINNASLADGSKTIAGEKAALIAYVEGLYAGAVAAQEQLKDLDNV